jgi:hypothetical protein
MINTRKRHNRIKYRKYTRKQKRVQTGGNQIPYYAIIDFTDIITDNNVYAHENGVANSMDELKEKIMLFMKNTFDNSLFNIDEITIIDDEFKYYAFINGNWAEYPAGNLESILRLVQERYSGSNSNSSSSSSSNSNSNRNRNINSNSNSSGNMHINNSEFNTNANSSNNNNSNNSNNNNSNNSNNNSIPSIVIPSNTVNSITQEPIVRGTKMVNFHNEREHGRYYTKATYNRLQSPKRNPFTRELITPTNTIAYKANFANSSA